MLPFPFSDLSRNKFRPALLIADVGRGDWIACQITSKPYTDQKAIEIAETDFTSGGLQRVSYVRPGKLFTANEVLFAGHSGQVQSQKLTAVREAVVKLIKDDDKVSSSKKMDVELNRFAEKTSV